MNYEEEKRHSLRYVRLPSLWEVSIFLLLIYAFYFQYGVRSISNAMLGLNGICILFGMANILAGVYKGKKTFYTWIIMFVVVSLLLGMVFGVSFDTSLDTGIHMMEYCLTGLSIYFFCTSHENGYKKVLFFTWLSILLLAINVLLNKTGVDYSGGAIGAVGLNTNEMSSFFILMVFCAFNLLEETNNKLQKLVIWASILLMFFTQIQSASRRGFIVMVFMIVMNIIFVSIPYNNQDSSRRRLVVYSLIILAGAIAFVGLRDYIFNSTVLGERLSGSMTGGDAARARYHAFAFEQFKNHPLFGVGVGGIDYLQGVYSHSLYYETISCTGVIGASILLISFIIPAKKLVKSIRVRRLEIHNQDKEPYLNRILLVYLVGMLISGFAVVMIYDFYFYISLSLIAAGIYLNSKAVS